MKPSNSVLSLHSLLLCLWDIVNFLLTPIRVILFIIAGSLIPLKGKRILFVVSVYLRMLRLTSNTTKAYDKLNQALKLAENTKALDLPYAIYELLWSEKLEAIIRNQPGELFFGGTKEQTLAITDMCGQIVQRTPMWLRYGDFGAMLKDSVRTVECVNLKDRRSSAR